MGVLDDHLLPSTEESSERNLNMKSKEAASGAGTLVHVNLPFNKYMIGLVYFCDFE